MLSREKKNSVLSNWALQASDTGSSQVQIGLLTARIAEITKHLTDHTKDQSSRRGLLKLVGRRRRLMRYLENNDRAAFKSVSERIK